MTHDSQTTIGLSRSRFGLGQPLYATSEYAYSFWGQPSISHLYFETPPPNQIHIIDGVYVVYPALVSSTAAGVADAILRSEFKAWESASDEDLSNWESGLN